MTSIPPQAAQLPASAQLNPQLVAIVQSMPADQQQQALAELQQMTPAQQAQLLAELSAQAQQQGMAQAAPATGAQTATLGAEALQPPSMIKTVLKNVVVLGGIGAALGFGASFLALPVIGQVAAPIAAAVGGAIGAIAGLVKGIVAHKKDQAAYDAATRGPVPGTDPSTQLPPADGGLPGAEQPGTQEPAPVDEPSPATKRSYTVKSGDSLWAIAQRFDTTWKAIYKANRDVVGPDPDLIHPGLKLKIPV